MAIEPKIVDAGKSEGGGRIIKRRHLTQEQRNQRSRRSTIRETARLNRGLKELQHEHRSKEQAQSHGHKITERSHTSGLRMRERSHIHNRALERDQIRASQRVQTQRALNTLSFERTQQTTRYRQGLSAKREVANAAVNQPVGPQVSQGTGTVGGAILRIFVAIILFSVLYLVLVNANATSGIIKSVGTGLVGLSSDKTLFVKRTA